MRWQPVAVAGLLRRLARGLRENLGVVVMGRYGDSKSAGHTLGELGIGVHGHTCATGAGATSLGQAGCCRCRRQHVGPATKHSTRRMRSTVCEVVHSLVRYFPFQATSPRCLRWCPTAGCTTLPSTCTRGGTQPPTPRVGSRSTVPTTCRTRSTTSRGSSSTGGARPGLAGACYGAGARGRQKAHRFPCIKLVRHASF